MNKNIKEKKISSNEAAKSFVDRAEKSKKINAYVTENFENCLKLSKEFDNKPNYDLKKSLSPDFDTGEFLLTETTRVVFMSFRSRTITVGTIRRNSGTHENEKKTIPMTLKKN